MPSRHEAAECADEVGILCRAASGQILNHAPIIGFPEKSYLYADGTEVENDMPDGQRVRAEESVMNELRLR